MRLQAGAPSVLIQREVRQRAKRLVGHRVDALLERQHAGSEPFALVASIRARRSTPRIICCRSAWTGEVVRALVGAAAVPDANVGVESPERFERDLPGDADVAPRVEMRPARAPW